MWKSRTDRPLRRARNEISRHEDQQTRRKRSHQFTRWIQADPTLPARVIGQISCWLMSPDVITSLQSLGFVAYRVIRCPAVPRDAQ